MCKCDTHLSNISIALLKCFNGWPSKHTVNHVASSISHILWCGDMFSYRYTVHLVCVNAFLKFSDNMGCYVFQQNHKWCKCGAYLWWPAVDFAVSYLHLTWSGVILVKISCCLYISFFQHFTIVYVILSS